MYKLFFGGNHIFNFFHSNMLEGNKFTKILPINVVFSRNNGFYEYLKIIFRIMMSQSSNKFLYRYLYFISIYGS